MRRALPPGLKKDCINSMIGTFDLREDAAWLLRSGHHEDDLKPLGQQCIKILTDYGQGSIFDYVFRTRLENGGASFRPIHDVCLHTEATRMAQALSIIQKLGTPSRSGQNRGQN